MLYDKTSIQEMESAWSETVFAPASHFKVGVFCILPIRFRTISVYRNSFLREALRYNASGFFNKAAAWSRVFPA